MGEDTEVPSIFGTNTELETPGAMAAIIAEKILGGESAAKIPVLTDESYIQINVKAAKNFNIEIPDELLGQAQQIIK